MIVAVQSVRPVQLDITELVRTKRRGSTIARQYLVRADLEFGFQAGVPTSTDLPVNLGPFQLDRSPNAELYLACRDLIESDWLAPATMTRSSLCLCCTSNSDIHATTTTTRRHMPTMLWTVLSLSSACSSPARFRFCGTVFGTLTRATG